MVASSPALRRRVDSLINNLHVAATSSRFMPLSSDSSTMDGLNVHGAIIGELHAHKTRNPLHGHQDGHFFHGCHDCHWDLPLDVFCGQLLATKLRRSNIDASAGALEEEARIVAQIRARWPRIEILLRADSGFAREALMSWCEANRVDYVFGLARNERLVGAIADELAAAVAESLATGAPARRFADFFWTTRESWSRERRVVAKAEHLPKGANPRFIVILLPAREIDARTRYEDVYCARGQVENRIKEQHLDLFADRTSAATPVALRPALDRAVRSRRAVGAPTRSGSGSRSSPTCCSTPCAGSGFATPSSRPRPAARSGSSSSRSAPRCA